jgi:hypothetical protein
MDIRKTDKYANYRYQIQSETELEEAKWLIKIGMFKDMDQYISQLTRSAIRRMKQEDKEAKFKSTSNRKIKSDKAA